MKKTKTMKWLSHKKVRPGILFFTSIYSFLLFFAVSQAWASETNQKQITLKMENASIKEILDELAVKCDKLFFYSDSEIDLKKKITVDLENKTMEEILQFIQAKSGNFTYEITDNYVTIMPAPQNKSKEKVDITIKGKVTDKDGAPLPGATIIISGTNKGITTNDEGEFVLAVPSEATVLRISFIGFETKTVTVGKQRNFTIVLNETATNLGEVVINGYQTLPKERATGSFKTIRAEELKKVGGNSFNLKNVIEDLVPGLYFEPNYEEDQNPSGENSRSIVIRGMSTFGDNNPLIVVDGFPLDPDISDPWSTINPDDVESVTVLKDAAAASIWGAQAANGVIVIVTKKGGAAPGKTNFNISLDYVTKPKPKLSKIPWASSEEAVDIYRWMVLDHDWFDNLMTTYYDTYDLPEVLRVLVDMKAGNVTQAYGDARLEELAQLDVRDEFSNLFLRPESQSKINISMQSGGNAHKVRTSLTAISNSSYSKGNSDYNFLANINDDYSPAKWLKFSVGMNLSISKEENNGVNLEGSSNYNDLINIPQHSRILDDNGDYLPMIQYIYPDRYYNFPTSHRQDTVAKYNLPYDWDWNLKREIDNRDNSSKNSNIRLSGKVALNPIEPLSIEMSYQYTHVNGLDRSYYNEETWVVRNMVNNYARPDGTYPVPPGGMLAETRTFAYSHDTRLQFNFNKKFGLHGITALAGIEWRKDYRESIPYGYYGYDPQSLTYSSSIDYSDTFTPKMSGLSSSYPNIQVIPGVYYAPSFVGKDNRYVSKYGNIGYTFKEKYDFTASIRQDKTNLYGQAPSYRDLPQWSIGFAWAISKEPFFKVDFVDNLKLRASYGFNGNVDKSASPYIYGYSWTDPVNFLPYLAVQSAPNPNLTWEKTKVINFGVDFVLFKNRLKGSLEYYKKHTTDALVQTAVNGTYGFQNNRATANAGTIDNNGVELDLVATVINNKNFTWRSTFSLGANKNKASDFTGVASTWTSYLSMPYYYHLQDQPVSYLAAMRWAGYDENGMPQFYYGENTVYSVTDAPSYSTMDKDSIITIVGQRDPKVYGAFINSFTYKNFELTIRLSYKFGHTFFSDYPASNMASTYTSTSNYFTWLPELMVNRWQSADDAETASMYSLNERITTSNVNTLASYLEHYSDKRAQDASHIRLQSISLSYKLPISTITWLRSAVLSFEARNLGCLWVANNLGVDPANPPYSSSTYGAVRFVTRYRPEYSFSLRLGL